MSWIADYLKDKLSPQETEEERKQTEELINKTMLRLKERSGLTTK